MAREIPAIFEIELLLAALLRRAGGGEALGLRIAQQRGAELLIDQDARLLPGRARGARRLEAVIDDAPGGGDLGGLRLAQGRAPAEHLGLEGSAMIEGHEVERPVIASPHRAAPLCRR